MSVDTHLPNTLARQGGFFLWAVENEFQELVEFHTSLSQDEIAKQDQKDAKCWVWGLSLLSCFILSLLFIMLV